MPVVNHYLQTAPTQRFVVRQLTDKKVCKPWIECPTLNLKELPKVARPFLNKTASLAPKKVVGKISPLRGGLNITEIRLEFLAYVVQEN